MTEAIKIKKSRGSTEYIRSILHNIPRFLFEFRNTHSLEDIYLFFYFNLPYLFPFQKFPSKITLEITNRCNFQCTHCHRNAINSRRVTGEMKLDLFNKIVDEISKHRGSILKIGGWGEPSMHPDIAEMLNYCSAKKVRTFLFTNGTIFDKVSIDEIMKWEGFVIEVSLDGSDHASYSKIRVGGNYKKLLNNISQVYEARKKLKKRYPRIAVQRVIFPHEGSKELNSFRRLFRKMTDTVDFCIYNPVEILSQPKMNINVASRFKPCKRIRRELSILYDGSVPVCGPQSKFENCGWLQNIKNTSISNNWISERMNKLRVKHKKSDLESEPLCSNCIYFR